MQTLVAICLIATIAVCLVIGSYFAIKSHKRRQKTYMHWAAACFLVAFALLVSVGERLFNINNLSTLAAFIIALLGCHQLFLGISYLHAHRDYGLNKYAIPVTVSGIALTTSLYFFSPFAETACVCFAALVLLLSDGGLSCERIKDKAPPSMLRRLMFFVAFTLFFHGVVSMAHGIGGGADDIHLLYQASLMLTLIATSLLAYTLVLCPVHDDDSDDSTSPTPNSHSPFSRHHEFAALPLK